MRDWTLFIADDDQEDIGLLTDALTDQQFQGKIETAANGQLLMDKLALSKNGSGLPDLLVVDLNMPLKSGYEVLKDVKSDSYLCKIPIVVFTSSIDQEDESICKNLGCVRYYRKPYNLAGFLEVAKDIMGLIDLYSRNNIALSAES